MEKNVEVVIENPISVDQIEKGVYLGNVTAAMSLATLKSLNISHILTIDSVPLPAYVTSNSAVINKYIQISDMPRENLLEYFDDCIGFIEKALENPKNNVLVHCYYGVSRSSTIVIAYLMRKSSISYEKAYDKAKAKRILVSPNHGFIQQLKLFHRMNFRIDSDNKKYKIFRLRLASDKVKSAKILPSSFMDLIKSDPGLMQENPEPFVYRCRKCRRVVATKSNLITHKSKNQDLSFESPVSVKKEEIVVPPKPPTPPVQHFLMTLHEEQAMINTGPENDPVVELAEKIRSNSLSDKSISEKEKEPPQNCKKMFFVEPLAWMKDVMNSTQGRLHCPKCQSKIGSFNWIMASKCPCGAQVSPSFYLVPSRIEYSNTVQNIVQMTV